MTKTLAAACLAALAMALPASATSGGCAGLTDPAGDERLPFTPTVNDPAPPQPRLAPIPDGPTDLVAVDAVASTAEVSVTFRLAAAPDPGTGASYEYRFIVDGADGGFELHAGLDSVPLPTFATYELFTADGRFPVSGSVDLSGKTVTVTAPASAFGVSSLAGRSWDVTEAETMRGIDGFLWQGAYDRAIAPAGTTLVAGAGC